MTTPFTPTRGPANPSETEMHHTASMMARRPDLKYVPGLGWQQYNGVKWTGGDNAKSELMREIVNSATALQAINPGTFAARLCTSLGLTAVASIAQWLPGVRVDPSELDTHKDWLHTAGTTWDLRTGSAWPTVESEMNTKAVDWEPAAGCPEWLDTLERCFPGEPEMTAYLQRLVGYGITGRTSEHAFILMHGNGRNGKSTFINVLTHAFRDYVEHIPVAVLMSAADTNGEGPSPMLLKMRGSRLVFTAETNRGGRLNESMVKLLTGGDEISARGMHKDPVTFKPEALIFMATNHKPEIQGTDDGIWGRVKLIEWRESFKGREDFGLEDRLKAEAPGIIDWALDGAAEWYRGKLREPERMQADARHFRAESDFFGTFIPDWIELDETSWLPNREIGAAYAEFSDANGLAALRNPATLYRALEERGATSAGRKGVRGYRVRRVR